MYCWCGEPQHPVRDESFTPCDAVCRQTNKLRFESLCSWVLRPCRPEKSNKSLQRCETISLLSPTTSYQSMVWCSMVWSLCVKHCTCLMMRRTETATSLLMSSPSAC